MESDREKYLIFSRRSLLVLLLMVLAIGGVCVAMAFRPAAPQWTVAVPVLLNVVMVVAIGLQRTLRGARWDPRKPEVRAILGDEWRQANMNRATRVALIVVLGAQLPLGLVLASLPTFRALMAMAATTITLGMATLLALFLYLDRDHGDAG